MENTSIDIGQVKRILEAALLTTQEPLALPDLKKLFDGSRAHAVCSVATWFDAL